SIPSAAHHSRSAAAGNPSKAGSSLSRAAPKRVGKRSGASEWVRLRRDLPALRRVRPSGGIAWKTGPCAPASAAAAAATRPAGPPSTPVPSAPASAAAPAATRPAGPPPIIAIRPTVIFLPREQKTPSLNHEGIWPKPSEVIPVRAVDVKFHLRARSYYRHGS